LTLNRRLIVTRSRRPVAEVSVRGVVTIGRHPQNTLLLDDKDVSRWHALLFVDSHGRAHLQDLGSRNGTLVRKSRINQVRLKSGDSFFLGGFTCCYMEGGGKGALESDTQATLGTTLAEESAAGGFLGKTKPAELLLEQVHRLAPLDTDVLITGETGSGKGIVAHLLHDLSPRGAGPFIAVNCAAIPSELQESELFGHKRGSFTGAVADHRGAFAEANGGTLFLDEIGDMEPRTQAKILKAVEDKKIQRVGDPKASTVELDIRIVAATHRDLEESSTTGAFREDLYYRLARATIRVPPLRERPDDVVLLANHFLVTVGSEMPTAQGQTFSSAARKVLRAHSWPGNVRELENVVRHALLWAAGPTIEPSDLDLRRRSGKTGHYTPGRTLAESLDETEAAYIRGALEYFDWNIAKTARELKIGPNRLRDRIDRYGLEPDDSR